MNLKVNTRSINGTSVIDLEGEVDVYTAPQLKQQIIDLLDGGLRHVVVNLTAVDYLDSTALGVLIGGLKRLRERNGALDLICPNPRIRRVFEITGLDKIFDIYATEDEAVEKLKSREGTRSVG
ncbi:MAG TPA: STAS domain-containing protein [Armatimonadota bacterium]|nr:STAS domain-containing protein [Armatimonadota bacterium]